MLHRRLVVLVMTRIWGRLVSLSWDNLVMEEVGALFLE